MPADQLDIAGRSEHEPAPVIASALIALDGVGLVAGDTSILTGISLAIRPSAPTALVGPNGSGKTTMLGLLAGLAAPTSGRIVERGTPALVKALVFQRPVMLRRSTAANVAYALKACGRPADTGTIDDLLQRVALDGLGDRPARRLSGGEQQRLALARALAREPELLLLDEPTASLDPRSTKAVEDILITVAAEGAKVVFATHDLGQARRIAGDVVMLAGGQIAEHATTADFFDRPRSEAARRFIAGELVF